MHEACTALRNFWKSKEIKTSNKLGTFSFNLKPVLSYVSETRRATNRITNKQQTFIK